MIVPRPAVRTIGLLSIAFALLWSFLMPTAERVVTPVSQTIPAVSAPASVHAPLGAPAHGLQKLRMLIPLIAVFLPLCSILLSDVVTRTRLERFAPPVPLLRKRLFLRPLKHTSKFVGL